MATSILIGDCRALLATLPDESVHCCVTSPPYFGLRDYGVEGQLGLEATPAAFIDVMVEVFRQVRRVLRSDGTLWLNIGDSYASSAGGYSETASRGTSSSPRIGKGTMEAVVKGHLRSPPSGLKPKDLIGVPWRLALALQDDGWYLRQDIIWSKPNPMPESVRDRCTKAHEYIFLLSKSERYHFDQEAILEPASPNTHARMAQNVAAQAGSDRVPGKTNGPMKAVGRKNAPDGSGTKSNESFHAATAGYVEKRNKRSVWTIATQPFKEAHFATFPPALVEPCIRAGCPRGGTVLDPFGGAGTTGLVAQRLQRDAILIELNPAYAEMARKRIDAERLTLFEGAA